jgi:hypothetical protein
LTFTVHPTPDEPEPVAPALVLLPVPELQDASPRAKRIKIKPRVPARTGRRVSRPRPGLPCGKYCFGTAFIIFGSMPIPSIGFVVS